MTKSNLKSANRTKFKSPHLWICVAFLIILIFIYQQWPWREWQIDKGVWRFFPWFASFYNVALLEVKFRIIGILFLIPILYATIVFRWRGALIVSLFSVSDVWIVGRNVWVNANSWIMNISFLLLPVAMVLIIKFELELRRKDRESIIRERQQYTSKVLEAQEKERQRIAQELHDETIQTLVAIAKRAESTPSANADDVSWIKEKTLATIDDLRRITLDLRPAILDDMGLIAALRWLVYRTNAECSTHIQILTNGCERRLPIQAEIAVFRVVQEAFNNIKQHSKAKEALVSVIYDAVSLKIRIQDDGQGFSPRKFSDLFFKGKLGLIGIQERIESLGGTCKINSEPGVGTEMCIEIKS